MDCYTIGIEAFPIEHVPAQIVSSTTEKWLKMLKKFKWSWRIKQLAKPRKLTPKYVYKPDWIPGEMIRRIKLDDGNIFYAEHLSKPVMRSLVVNKKQFGKLSKKLHRKFNKRIRNAWNSIYNFYKNKERLKRLREVKSRKELSKEKSKPKVFHRTVGLATPKKIHKPPPSPKSKKIFGNYMRLDAFASPKVHFIEPSKREGINPHALTYEPTENMLKLARPPHRPMHKPLELGKVHRGALRYKITPKVEALAVPKRIREKAKVEDDFDPWAISANALKYRATPRIVELAKPIERN